MGGTFERGLRGVRSAKPAQHRAAGCVYQVIAVEARCDRVERGERGAGTLGLGDGDGPVEGNHGCGHDREQVVVEGDDLGPVGCLERAGVAVHGLDRGLELEGTWLAAADTGAHDRMSFFDHRAVPHSPVLVAQEHKGTSGCAGRRP